MKTLATELDTENITIIPRDQESDDMLIASDRNPNTNGAKLILAENPAEKLNSILEATRSGQVKAVIVANEDLTEAAGFTSEDLDALELLVSLSHSANATAQACDIVLPTAGPAEKRGSMINVTGRLQKLNAASIPPGDARVDWEAIRDLILTLSGETPSEAPQSIDQLSNIICESIGELNNHQLAKIPNNGTPVMDTGITIPLIERENARKESGEIVG